jgi:hypothetical protein
MSFCVLCCRTGYVDVESGWWRSRFSRRGSRLVDRRRGYPGAARDREAAAAIILTCRAIEKRPLCVSQRASRSRNRGGVYPGETFDPSAQCPVLARTSLPMRRRPAIRLDIPRVKKGHDSRSAGSSWSADKLNAGLPRSSEAGKKR